MKDFFGASFFLILIFAIVYFIINFIKFQYYFAKFDKYLKHNDIDAWNYLFKINEGTFLKGVKRYDYSRGKKYIFDDALYKNYDENVKKYKDKLRFFFNQFKLCYILIGLDVLYLIIGIIIIANFGSK